MVLTLALILYDNFRRGLGEVCCHLYVCFDGILHCLISFVF